jgi:very-short-patch-repair endonuclease
MNKPSERLKKTSLSVSHPSIAQDWDAEKNVSLLIGEIGSRDRIAVWWTCEYNHTYKVSPYTRIRTDGCKVCRSNQREPQNRLASRLASGNSKKFSDVATATTLAEWAADLNELRPDQITTHSKRKIAWRCAFGHLWNATPSSRVSGSGCPHCYKKNRTEILLRGKLKQSGMSLAERFPDLMQEWDYSKNSYDPNKLTPYSGYKVFWTCKFGHSWKVSIGNRTGNGSGCPFCTNQTSKIEIYILCELRSLFDQVEWRKKIDGVEADIYLTNEKIAIEVDGDYWHKDKLENDKKKSAFFTSLGLKTIRVRSDKLPKTDDTSVSFSKEDNFAITLKLIRVLTAVLPNINLKNYLVEAAPRAEDNYRVMVSRLPAPPVEQSFQAVYPAIAKEWDYQKNLPLTPDLFTPKSDQKFWWICSHEHSWEATIKNRTLRGSNCPGCNDASHRANTQARHLKAIGSLAEKYPELVSFWDSFSNGGIEASQISSSVQKTYMWKCTKGHKFSRMLKTMVKDQNCPVCHSIFYESPTLKADWDYEKNIDIKPTDISVGSDRSVWWICPNKHSWQASPVRRLKDKRTCPTCQSLSFRFPNLMKEWDFSKNYDLNPIEINAGNKTKVWWKCSKGHQWQATISGRAHSNSNCPICSKQIAAENTRLVKLSKSGSLADNFPELARKWNAELNGETTPSAISSNSHRKFWWVCDCGSTFEKTPNDLVTLLKRGSSYTCKNCHLKK